MARYIEPRFKNHVFVNSDYISLSGLISAEVVNAIEVRNKDNILYVRSTKDTGEVDEYIKNEIFKLNQETIRPGIKGFNIKHLEIAGSSGNRIRIEFHV